VGAFFISGSAGWQGGPEPTELAAMVLDGGGEPVVSLPARDRPREDVLQDLRRYHSLGVRNLLVVTGDYPGDKDGRASFFDLETVQLLMLLREAAGEEGDLFRELRTGCVVSPFKKLEAETIWQYARLERKAATGADFIVSQAGFDVRAWDELVRFVRSAKLGRPVIGNVLVPDLALARRIAGREVPGISMPPSLLAKITDEEVRGEAGRRERLTRAARSLAVLRGLGYQGALLGGRLSRDDVAFVLGEAEEAYPRWKEFTEETSFPEKRFYYFTPGEDGLNEDVPAPVAPRTLPHPMYLFSHFVDYVAFGSWEPLFRVLTRICAFCDTRPFWRRLLWLVEYLGKRPPYGCRMCGDCTLYACGFLCCEAGCPKRMLNGPCGGSLNGGCEVEPGGRRCVWVTIYERLKGTADRPGFVGLPIPARNRDLDGTSSWINFCLGRDHRKFTR
jgi:methylenetetrahydrofolate reductase (NADPH)